MQIIINSKLRELKKRLVKTNIKYQEFMLSKEILKFDTNTQIDIISSLQNINLNKEQFHFLIMVYNENKDLFYKLTTLIRENIEFGKNEIELYFKNKDIYDLLVNIKINNTNINSLDQSFIDMWGIDFIKDNYDIINNFNYDEMKENINIIKNHSSVLRDALPLLNNPANKKYFNQVLLLSNKENVQDIVHNLILLEDDFLKKIYLDNYNDYEFKDFLNLIINKYNGKMPLGYCNDFVKELTKATGIKDLLAKKIYYGYLSQYKQNDDIIQDGSSSIIFNTDVSSVHNAYSIVKQAYNKEYPVPKMVEYLYQFYDDLSCGRKTSEEALNRAYDSIYNNITNFDFNEVIKWVKEFKSWELSQDIINPKKKNIDYYETYTYVDESGKQVTKQIPVIKLDDPDFMAIVHNVSIKNESTSPANYKLTEKLVNHPELWETTRGGNPNISMSYLFKQFGIFGGNNGVLLGFSEIKPEKLLATISSDGATSMNRPGKDNTIRFCPHEGLKEINGKYGWNGWGYNEILTKRYYNDEVTKPDYIMIVSGVAKTFSIEIAKKWASYFEIPIVEIDGKKLKQYHMARYQVMLDKIKNNHYIENYHTIDQLYEEIALIESYCDIGEEFTTPTLYETFYTITKSLDINIFQNAQYINELLDWLEQTQKWFEIGYNTRINLNTHQYCDTRISEEVLKSMYEYIMSVKNQCNQVINGNKMQMPDGKSR